ncbi:MAG: LysR family transcriptional regulator [Burkholderiaceae bacterium]
MHEHRHIGRAAEAPGISRPALTRAVARLKAFTGRRLLTRHPKGVMPTEAGETLVRRARRILLEHEDTARKLQQIKTGQLGLIRVGYSASVAQAGLAPLNVRVETHSGNSSQSSMLTGTRMLCVCSDRSLDTLPGFHLTPISVPDLPLDRDIGVIRRADAYVPPIARTLEELLLAQFDPGACPSVRADESS